MEQHIRASTERDRADVHNPDAGEGPDVPEEDKAIGRNARRIRKRRGLAIDVVADLAGISKGHLSMLETGKRAWIRRGVVEDVAAALSCSVADLTGQPYVAPDQQSAIAAGAIPALQIAVNDATIALMAMNRGHGLMRIGARYRAASVLTAGIGEVTSGTGPSKTDTRATEALGMLHLTAALLGARDPRHADTDNHLREARDLAAYTGDRNHMYYHFGPTNVATWELSIGVESDAGPEAAERFEKAGVDLSVLDSRDRASNVHFDLARAWAQAEGSRDDQGNTRPRHRRPHRAATHPQ